MSKTGPGSRDANRCQYRPTCITDPGKWHQSVTAMSANPIPYVEVVTSGQCRYYTAEREGWGLISYALKQEAFG